MDYPLENLSPERFQEFCQALLVREYKDMQCFPVAQPDGGRDAWQHRGRESKMRPALFQVKFVRRPDLTSDAHSKLVSTMKSEVSKLSPAITKSIKKYIVLTNVSGTAHPGAGSIDLLQKVLDDGLPVPGEVWWRDDITRRLDGAWDLKWAYPELMTAPDLLRALVETGLKEDQSRRANAIRGFLLDQYRTDQEVRFKQIELQNLLVELFVDVPVSTPQQPADKRGPSKAMLAIFRVAQAIAERRTIEQRTVMGETLQEDSAYFSRDDRFQVGAATLLLHPYFQSTVPKLVLEGAPGQGKSTISQYICQVHRARLLGYDDTLSKLPAEHKSGPMRLPFRIDLRDLAMWLARKDPFNADNEGIPQGWHKSLDAFMSAQVQQSSGGANFSVSDLHAVFQASALLIVFDGLDEVADIESRRDVVEEITRATGRLKDMSLSLQAVVTSRPAAFANSPGPSDKEFPYFQLDSLPQTLVFDYAERWLKAKRMPDREAATLRKLLREKLGQPHMRDLARNPMQLAILLSLMHTRGASLPDKRTALYGNYVETFFNREAEKSQTVRDHRDLLIGIHGYIAWLLHGEAQGERSGGSITAERLRQVVRGYMTNEGHEISLVDDLFTGMVERVVALVSRVQGTYEFEVQPLREYFAARFLYETAPYSPAGDEKRGTRPDRFDALARDYYWLNVTRFYAGCFCKGELPALVDRIEVLLSESPFKHTAHPRVLAAMLLADWVFAQHPRSVATLVQLILKGVGLRAIAAVMNPRTRAASVLVLPNSSGRDELIGRAFAVLEKFPPRDYAIELVEVLRSNANAELLEREWQERLIRINPDQIVDWFDYGRYLRVVPRLENEKLQSICLPMAPLARLKVLFSARRSSHDGPEYSVLDQAALTGALLDLDIRRPGFRSPANIWERLAAIVDINRYVAGLRRGTPYSLRSSWQQFGDSGEWLDERETSCTLRNAILCAADEATQRLASEWATSLDP